MRGGKRANSGRKPSSEKKDKVFTIKVTEKELKEIKGYLKVQPNKTMSEALVELIGAYKSNKNTFEELKKEIKGLKLNKKQSVKKFQDDFLKGDYDYQ